MDKKYTVRIFDGQSTWIYTTQATDIYRAERKVLNYHTTLHRDAIKVTTTEIR